MAGILALVSRMSDLMRSCDKVSFLYRWWSISSKVTTWGEFLLKI